MEQRCAYLREHFPSDSIVLHRSCENIETSLLKAMSVTKASGRYPVTALDVVSFNDGGQFLLWGGGPELFVNNLDTPTSAPIASFTLSSSDSIHNISPLESINAFAAFGGKSLLLVSKTDATRFETFAAYLQLDDMILDFAIPKAQNTTNLFATETLECMIGYAHNFVDMAVLHRDGGYGRLKRIHCPELSVLFNMKFFPGGNVIASGTVFGKIIVWSADATTGQGALLCNAHEHEGVIFRIKLSDAKDHLITVSDDRTVRLWSIKYNDSTSLPASLSLMYTGWGHISRVWDAVFLSNNLIATCSEDASVKLWDAQGKCMATLRGHGSDVWRLATSHSGAVLVSGGNDASVKVWDVAYQLKVAPDAADSTVVSVPIPTWQFPAIAETENVVSVETVGAEGEGEGEDLDDLPLIKRTKKKASASSRRANGVCTLRISPCLQWLVVVLVDGGVWLVRRAGASSDEHEWVQVTHLGGIISTADAHFIYRNNVLCTVQLLVALLKGDNVYVSVSVAAEYASFDSAAVTVSYSHIWRAHEFRTVNIWFFHSSLTTNNDICVLAATATIKGALTVWELSDSNEPQPYSNCATPGGEIVTAIGLIRRDSISYVVVGDARGSVSLFALPDTKQEAAMAPLVAFMKLHGSDPVSCIEPHSSGFVTAGHDGMVHIYQEVLAGTGPSLSWVHASKLNCLPINTPDQIIVTEDNAAASDARDVGLFVCGYHGSAFMIWDLRRGYQVMRVEGGGWKRPHRCMLSSNANFPVPGGGTPLVRGLPSVLFVCPAPLLKDNTVLQLFGAQPVSAKPRATSPDLIASFPQHLGCPAHGKVAYCNTLLSIPTTQEGITKDKQFVVVGGEESCVKVFSVLDLLLCQEMSLSLNSSLKSLSSAHSATHPARGIVLGGGGKLQYYIWTYDGALGCTSTSSLGAVLHTAAEGTTWAKATQDHRILSVQCAYLDASVSVHPKSGVELFVERYSILLCDSRGMATLGLFEYAPLSATTGDKSLVAYAQFRVLQTLQPSQCPLLSSSLLHVSERRESVSEKGEGLVAIFGDTAGNVSVWTLAREKNLSLASTVWQQAVKCGAYVAHSMGANALSATVIAGAACPNNAAQLLICSGGDDQSISCARCTVQFDSAVVENEVQIEVCKVIGASGSAIKGLKLLPTPASVLFAPAGEAGGVSAECEYHLASAGYDQRLSLWAVTLAMDDPHSDYQDHLKPSDPSNTVRVEWKAGAMVNVSDVGALDVLPSSVSAGASAAEVVCCVVGEGVQIFDVAL